MKKTLTLKKQVATLNATVLKLTKVIETLQESILNSLAIDVHNCKIDIKLINGQLSNLESMNEIVEMYDRNGGSLDFYDDEEIKEDISYNEDINLVLKKHIFKIERNMIIANTEQVKHLFAPHKDVFISVQKYVLDAHWMNLVKENVSDDNLFLQYSDEMGKVKNLENCESHFTYRTQDNHLHIFQTLKEMIDHKLLSDFKQELERDQEST